MKPIEVLTHDQAMRQLARMTAARDKALEALKQVAETVRSGHGECIEWLDATIKELETSCYSPTTKHNT